MKKLTYAFLLLAALAVFAGCGSSSNSSNDSNASTDTGATASQASTTGGATGTATASAGTAVEIKGFAFGPETLMVNKGDSVTFTNNDSAPHTATADNKSFDTGTLSPGDTKDVSFDAPGTIPYTCSIHPFMHGSIVVQ